MNKRYYICDKDNNEIVYGYIDYDKLTGFKVKPQNKVPYEGVEVSRLTLVEPELIQKVLRRKTKKQLNIYLQFLMTTLEDDSDDDEHLSLVINDIERYRNIIVNKYSKFLDKKYITNLLKNVDYIKQGLIDKLNELVEEHRRIRWLAYFKNMC